MGVTVDLGHDLAGAELVESGYDSLVEVMIPKDVGHIRTKGGIALEKTGRNVSRDNNISAVGRGCKFRTLEQILKCVVDIYHTFESLFQPSDLPTGVQTRVVGAVIEVRVQENGDKTVLEDMRVKPAARRELASRCGILDQIVPAALLQEVGVECVVLGEEARRAGVVVAHDRQDFGVGKALPDERGNVPFG